jgi:hypothetical protein
MRSIADLTLYCFINCAKVNFQFLVHSVLASDLAIVLSAHFLLRTRWKDHVVVRPGYTQ